MISSTTTIRSPPPHGNIGATEVERRLLSGSTELFRKPAAGFAVMFVAGGKVRPGLLGKTADLGRVHNGGIEPTVDFRQIYAGVLRDWLKVEPKTILGENIAPFQVVS
jgi:hypothetical protein